MRQILTLFITITAMYGFSQENLVPNGTFKNVGKKVKELGQIDQAEGWSSPTDAKADLFVKDTKSELVGTRNIQGEEKAMEDDNYIGIRAYAYKGKLPRTYAQVKLSKPLEAGKSYCVKFHVSLADLAKYACNYVGAYLSKDAVSAKNTDPLKFEPQVVSKRSTVYDKQFYWTPVCRYVKAKGGEQYLTIGNFTDDLKLKTLKIRRPKGFYTPQTYDAYYYVDNVSVVEGEKCDCDVIPGMADAETVERNFNSDPTDKTYKPKIIGYDGQEASATGPDLAFDLNSQKIEFDPNSFSIIGDAAKKLDKIAEYIKKEKVKVSIYGHIDASETKDAKLDGKRANAVYKYLISKGVDKTLLTRELSGSNEPVDPKNKLKNMRVEFMVDDI